MSARPLPPPEPDLAQKKTGATGTAESFMKQPFLVRIRSISKAPALQEQLRTVLKKRWLRVAGIAVAILVVLLFALPFLIDVNSFRPKIESEATNALGRQVKLGDLSLSILSGTVVLKISALPTIPPSASRHLSARNRSRWASNLCRCFFRSNSM